MEGLYVLYFPILLCNHRGPRQAVCLVMFETGGGGGGGT